MKKYYLTALIIFAAVQLGHIVSAYLHERTTYQGWYYQLPPLVSVFNVLAILVLAYFTIKSIK